MFSDTPIPSAETLEKIFTEMRSEATGIKDVAEFRNIAKNEGLDGFAKRLAETPYLQWSQQFAKALFSSNAATRMISTFVETTLSAPGIITIIATDQEKMLAGAHVILSDFAAALYSAGYQQAIKDGANTGAAPSETLMKKYFAELEKSLDNREDLG